MRARFVDVAVTGGDLTVAVHGPPSPRIWFVAIHDAVGNGAVWDAVIRRLPAEIGVLAPDLRGRGASRRLPGPYSLDQIVDDLDVVIDHFEVDQAGTVGIGSGAVVAEAFRALVPDIVAVTLAIEASDPSSSRRAQLDMLARRDLDRDRWATSWREQWTDSRQTLCLDADAFVHRGLVPIGDGVCWGDDDEAVVEAHGWGRSTAPSRMIVVGPDVGARSPNLGTVHLADLDAVSVLLTADGADAVARVMRSLLH